jgi:hypothetical protein
MKRNFPNKRIIIPEEAGLSVLKGAVLFGHKPDYIASRVMRFSYGTDISVLFDPENHEQHRKYTCDGRDRCLGIFSAMLFMVLSNNDFMTSASILNLSPRSAILLANGED